SGSRSREPGIMRKLRLAFLSRCPLMLVLAFWLLSFFITLHTKTSTTMSAPIVTGLMSYGMSGRIFHAPFLTTNPGFKFKAVVERHEKKTQQRYPDVISYDTI